MKLAFADGEDPNSAVHRESNHLRSDFREADARQGRRSVLVIDDDATVRESCAWTLTLAGLWVETVSTGAEGVALAHSKDFDLLLLELSLPDMTGVDAVRTIRHVAPKLRFVFAGDRLTVPLAIEAMRLGAIDVLEKPVPMERLLEIATALPDVRPSRRRQLSTPIPASESQRPLDPPPHVMTRPGSVAERWAMHVLKACDSKWDVKTLRAWAACAGVSYSSLRECCDLVGIRPHDARDLTRMLRAVIQSLRQGCAPDVLLDVSDRRTSESLFERAGLAIDSRSGPHPVSVEQFFARQGFVVRQNAGLRALQLLLDERARAS